jgi:uncharacterized protein YbbC (DUF1343 family)
MPGKLFCSGLIISRDTIILEAKITGKMAKLMISDYQYRQLFKQLKSRYAGARCGIFTNQTSYCWEKKKYLISLIGQMVQLESIFIPEHGFFAELQDQVPVRKTEHYDFLRTGTGIYSLYPGGGSGLEENLEKLSGLDLLIVDIQETGARYFTYVTMLGKIMDAVRDKSLSILLVDRPNPAGRMVEGTILPEEFTSLIGLAGLVHRYGLTIGELAAWLKDRTGGRFELEVIKMSDLYEVLDLSCPSPNIPHPITPRIYPGQCLWEGTNVSEGRGTTRPFEIFGAPFFRKLMTDWVEGWNEDHPEAILRPLVFMPVFHKYRMEYCYGFQLHPLAVDFSSLWYSLQLIRAVRQELPDFAWREGPYETGSEKPAIELLAGDPLLLDYLNGSASERIVLEKLGVHERQWVDQCKGYILYGDRLLFRS